MAIRMPNASTAKPPAIHIASGAGSVYMSVRREVYAERDDEPDKQAQTARVDDAARWVQVVMHVSGPPECR